jgi:opacity protein-like surface antigen
MIRRWIHFALLIMIGSPVVLAGDFKRFEFQPFSGFTGSGSIPLIAEDGVQHGSIHVNSSYNYGATFAVNLNELDAVEALWQRQPTEGRLPTEFIAPHSPGNSPTFNLNLDQYHCNFLHHYKIADPRAMPYVVAGLGATVYHANRDVRSVSKAYFSFALGGGIKYFLTNHIGIRGEARWSPTLISASDSKFWCSIGGSGAACVINLDASLQHQFHLTGGFVFRF